MPEQLPDDVRMALRRAGVAWSQIHRLDDIRANLAPDVQGPGCEDCNEHVLLALVDRLAAENAHLEGWGQNTMDDCVAVLTKARDALYGVLTALGLGYGSSALLDELDEAVRQIGTGKR